ncbi:MAG: aminomethyl-transferring glycine dehydrogenase subunit GcvPA [Dehalococcoidia bacterium]|nr:aminomethyl-transferring glycine dehydrogenase subunit GcvPA [Dehalococcoidia bacterium]
MTPEDREDMLAAIGVASADALFADIPASARAPDVSRLPAPLSEYDLVKELRALSNLNTAAGSVAFFRGGGVYRRYTPSVVSDIIRRGEFLTSYTPYQAEASQGTLQVAFEFQSIVCALTGMEVANAGMYDGASALAEACLMACRVTGRERLAIADSVNPRYARVVQTYAEPQGIAIDRVAAGSPALTNEHACLVLQTPDHYGRISLVDDGPSKLCKENGALLVVAADVMSLALFRPPREFGADIVVGDGQALGLSMSFGGPYVGLFTTKQEHIRQMPGRIVGQTTDLDGRRAFVLTLQAREQHIRRERASSNICTSEQLLALAATVYVGCLGKQGMQQVARLCYEKSHYAAKLIGNLRGWGLVYPDAPFFQEFVIRCPRPVAKVNYLLRRQGIIGGLDVSAQGESRMLVCVTETNTREEIDRLFEALEDMAGAE